MCGSVLNFCIMCKAVSQSLLQGVLGMSMGASSVDDGAIKASLKEASAWHCLTPRSACCVQAMQALLEVMRSSLSQDFTQCEPSSCSCQVGCFAWP